MQGVHFTKAVNGQIPCADLFAKLHGQVVVQTPVGVVRSAVVNDAPEISLKVLE